MHRIDSRIDEIRAANSLGRFLVVNLESFRDHACHFRNRRRPLASSGCRTDAVDGQKDWRSVRWTENRDIVGRPVVAPTSFVANTPGRRNTGVNHLCAGPVSHFSSWRWEAGDNTSPVKSRTKSSRIAAGVVVRFHAIESSRFIANRAQKNS
jgi:hypothetical protein